MSIESLLKILCAHNGSMEYERLLDLSYGLPEITDLDQIIIKSPIFSVIQHSDSKEVIVKSAVKLCKNSECDGVCRDLHLCKYYLMTGYCKRPLCDYVHKLMSEHNIRVLTDHRMFGLNRDEVCVVLLISDPNILPPVCVKYNKGGGPYGNCPDKEQCTRLHVCESFIRGRCDVTDCHRSHDFRSPHVVRILRRRGVPDHLLCSLNSIYHNIVTLKSYSGDTHFKNTKQPVGLKRNSEAVKRSSGCEICLCFVKGYCKNRDCGRIHFEMPYKWEVRVGDTWTLLPNNEEIERDYCRPSNIYSSGAEPVCFEEMILGLDEVRRLSTAPSVLFPSFILTTTWVWYWRDEYNQWIQYASVKEMHRLSSVSSEDLEKKYQEYLQLKNPSDQDAVVKFKAGNRFYELNFKDMAQRNEVSGRERPIRRRPAFISSVDVQIIKNSRRSSSAKPRIYKGVPGFWDKSAIPYCGFQKVCLQPSHRDYMRVQDMFGETMRGFTIRQIERVQNRELWENFITKREAMKKANKERFGERLLFQATKFSLVDFVCQQNFDIEMSDTTVYGKGIYFSKDAQSCHMKTDECGASLMFVCRVLLGHYTRGDSRYHRPPSKKTAGDQYDSCVDNLREPSVFVLFEKSQIYPEFLVTYEQKKLFEVLDNPVTSITLGVAHVNLKDGRQSPEASDVGQNLISGSCGVSLTSTPGSASGKTSPSLSSSRETDSILHSTLHKDSSVPSKVPVSDVSKTTLKLVLSTKSLTPLESGVQPLHVGKSSDDSEHQNISVHESISGSSSENIQEVPQIRSDFVCQHSVDLSGQLGTESRDLVSRVVQYSNNTVKLDMLSPPVHVMRTSVVSSAQRSSESVPDSSLVSSRRTVDPQLYQRENSSATRQRTVETIKTTSKEKPCTVQ
ncbi:protein mono-ADP-ribosyltransferase PARP12-like [Paramisgurnus dabryanus]|uniref:protein mono-ADP-ribosyltransferase PARP12-like n=1 Tax=Paramisgurnus dabryanus TaxID=90735 RepID=UPI0031F3F877